MADITDPIAIKFCNEKVRPLAERARALYYLMQDFLTEWNGGTATFFAAADSSPVQDGRDDAGVSRLTAWDVVTFQSKLAAAIAEIETSDDLDPTVAKPCVSALNAS